MFFLRRIRATAVFAVLWAACWAIVGLLIAVGLWYAGTSDVVFEPAPFIGVWSAWGAISGAAFALLLAAMEARQSARSLRSWRVAIWGGCAGLVLPLVFLVLTRFTFTVEGLAIVAGAGAGVGIACGALTLRIARGGSDGNAAA